MRKATTRFQVWSWIATTVAVFTVSTPNVFSDIPPGSRSGEYLIVTASEFFGGPALGQFSAAKTLQGFDVAFYEAVPGTTRDTIRSYIQDEWYTPTADCYVLLVGDCWWEVHATPDPMLYATQTSLPFWLVLHGGSDLPYASTDGGDDWYPDLFIGRFPVCTETQLQAIVDKTLHVEAGVFSDPTYAKRAAFLANALDQSAHAFTTHDWVIDTYMAPAGFDSTTVYHPEGGTQEISDAVNAGTLFLVYGGHSSGDGWWCPMFHREWDVMTLHNEGLYGLVYGWSCNTASYSYPYDNPCFGKTWIRESDKGAAAYRKVLEELNL